MILFTFLFGMYLGLAIGLYGYNRAVEPLFREQDERIAYWYGQYIDELCQCHHGEDDLMYCKKCMEDLIP